MEANHTQIRWVLLISVSNLSFADLRCLLLSQRDIGKASSFVWVWARPEKTRPGQAPILEFTGQ